MDIILFTYFVIIFLVIYTGFQCYYNSRNRKKEVDHNVLEENIKTSDLYEIIYLKLGKEAVKEAAIGHLIKSGYLEVKSAVLKANVQKDLTKILELEKSLLGIEISSHYGEFVLNGDAMPFQSVIKKYEKKAQVLHLFYKRGRWFKKIEISFNLFLTFFGFYYIFQGHQFNWFERLFIVVVSGFILNKIIYKLILEKPATVQIRVDSPATEKTRGNSSKPSLKASAEGHILTSNGKRYIQIFEEKNFAIDPIIDKYFPTCPCSVFD